MIILLDTRASVCHLVLYKGGTTVTNDKWQADRTLAENIFNYIEKKLVEHEATWDDVTGFGVFRGPGSFTGLRIGIAVCNAFAHDKKIPIIGTTGDNWQKEALKRLEDGEDDKIVLPEYGRDARITKPRK